MFELYIQKGFDVTQYFDNQAILYACGSSEKNVRLLLNAGLDPNKEYCTGGIYRYTILSRVFHNPVSTKMLLDAGADPNLTYSNPWDTTGRVTTPIEYAVLAGCFDSAELLIEYGAKI